MQSWVAQIGYPSSLIPYLLPPNTIRNLAFWMKRFKFNISQVPLTPLMAMLGIELSDMI
jgi:hypothetical protein